MQAQDFLLSISREMSREKKNRQTMQGETELLTNPREYCVWSASCRRDATLRCVRRTFYEDVNDTFQ